MELTFTIMLIGLKGISSKALTPITTFCIDAVIRAQATVKTLINICEKCTNKIDGYTYLDINACKIYEFFKLVVLL